MSFHELQEILIEISMTSKNVGYSEKKSWDFQENFKTLNTN